MTKKRKMYYQDHEKLVVEDILNEAREKDFLEVRNIFMEYGRFLERHEEALTVLA